MYVDSCIIVKLIVREPDSAFFEEALSGERLSSSELAWTEVQSTLFAKQRTGDITAKASAEAWAAFTGRVETKQIKLHALDLRTLKKANRVMAGCHPKVALRTLDAIHTAACDLSQDFPLCSTDRRMRDAADVLGIPIFPPSEPLTADS